MRVTQQVKTETRQRILSVSLQLFREKGFDATTTRDIARAAKIATGTLFNYFSSKEAIVLHSVFTTLDAVNHDFRRRAAASSSLEENLFSLVAAGLRKLRPYRSYAQSVVETCLHSGTSSPEAEAIRTAHLELVSEQIAGEKSGEPVSAVESQLYWTLYTGVLAFWTTDTSRNQEDTLALLDQSLNMFVSWLRQSRDAQSHSSCNPSGEL